MTTIVTDPKAPSVDDAELLAAYEAADKDAMENWHDPVWRAAMAKEVTDQVWYGFQHENLLPNFSTVENAAVGDRITVETVYGVEVFWVSLGGQIDMSTMTQDVYQLTPDWVGFHVQELDQRVQMGFSRVMNQMVQNAIQQMDASISSRLFRAFQAAIPSSSDYYVASNGLQLADLNTAITEVGEEIVTPGANIAIVGRPSMVNQIMDQLEDSGNFYPETNEQIVRTGMLGRYRGIPVVRLQNFRDRNKRSYFPRNELMVVSTDASKVGFWGTLVAKEGTEQFGWQWHYIGRREVGMAVHRPEAARRFVDTSLAA